MFILSNYIKPNLLKTEIRCFNSSFVPSNNDLYLLGRNTNYIFVKVDNFIKMLQLQNGIYSDENIFKYNNVEDKWVIYKSLSSVTVKEQNEYAVKGDEDFRLIKWNNKLYGSYTKAEQKRNKAFIADIHITELDKNLSRTGDIKICTGNIEKNWQPVEGKPFIYVYKYQPFTIVNLNTKKYLTNNNKFDLDLRGSSQIILYKGNYIAVVHYRNGFDYCHYFVMFDSDLNLIKISDSFKFFGANIEFCTYIKLENENSVMLLVSVNDAITYSFKLSDTIFNDIFEDKLDNSIIVNDLYDSLFYDALNIDNASAISFATFSTNNDVKNKAKNLNLI